MTFGPTRRLIVVVALAVAGLVTPSAVAAPAARADSELRIVVDRLEPKAPGPGAVLTLGGWVENVGHEDVSDVRIRLRASSRAVSSRSRLAVLAEQRDPVGERVPGASAVTARTLPPTQRADWSLSVPADRLGFGGFGVHALQLEAVGQAGRAGPRPLVRLTTFLPWVPATARVAPTRVVWLWPVAGTPRQSVGEVFLDDDLAAAFAPGGRLHRLVDAGRRAGGGTRPVPLTWVIDPAVVDAAAGMSDGYAVAGRGPPERDGQGAAAARDWLAELRRATRQEARPPNVVTLPYADPDVVALNRIGLDGELGYRIRAGRQIVARVLGTARDAGALEGPAYPPDGLVTDGALEALVGVGTRSLVLADLALPPARPPSHTPDARAQVDTVAGRVPVALTDSTLTTTLGAARRAEDARLVEQRFLAETALITAELPGRSRTIVVAPPRRWSPPTSLAHDLLADTAHLPWLAPTALDSLLGDVPPDATAAPVPRYGPRYPDRAANAELDSTHLSGVASLAGDVRLLRSILVGDGELGSELMFARWRTESAAWRQDRGTGRRLLRAVRAATHDMHRRVGIASGGLFTLTSRTGSVPLTVSNGLPESVRVQVSLRARNAEALSAPGATTVTIAAGQKPTIPLTVTAHVNGVVPVTARLLTPDGRPLSPPVTLRVRSTAYASVGLAVTLGALAVLLLAVTVRLTRRALRATARRRGGR